MDVMLLTLGWRLCVHGAGYSWMQDSLLTPPFPISQPLHCEKGSGEGTDLFFPVPVYSTRRLHYRN